MKFKLIATLLLSIAITFPASASFIASKSYRADGGDIYWTNFDLGLDVLRLDWADTLGGGPKEQKSLSDFHRFVDSNLDGWRFATLAEFNAYYNWFDSDPNNDGWSLAQNAGANLFFELNGYGPAFNQQYGFDHEGYTYWQFGTLDTNADLGENPMTYVWFADFGDQNSKVTCVDWSVLCAAGYFPDVGSPMFTAHGALSMSYASGNPLNVAPLLVRTTNTINNVNEAKISLFFGVFLVWLIVSKRVRRNSLL